MDKCVFGSKPIMDDLTKVIFDFLYSNCLPQIKNIEIEAKIGVLIDKNTNQRISVPAKSECVLFDAKWYRFESNISQEYHKRYNQFFNERVSYTNRPDFESPRIVYKHVKSIDCIFDDHLFPNKRIRATFDSENKLLEVIRKVRIADLAIHCPNSPFDVRISINSEEPVNKSLIEKATPASSRQKDRLSYHQQPQRGELFCRLDLTQVKSNQTAPSYELEVEIVDGEKFVQERERHSRSIENSFGPICENFVDTIRMIVYSFAQSQPQ